MKLVIMLLYQIHYIIMSKCIIIKLSWCFWFLYTNIEDYGSSNVDPNGVQLMTVHKAKGLEFPVVIVASFSDKKFPSKFISPNPDNGYIHENLLFLLHMSF